MCGNGSKRDVLGLTIEDRDDHLKKGGGNMATGGDPF